MKINKKKPQITSSETSAKTSNINGFQQLTVTDEQCVKATPKCVIERPPFWSQARGSEFDFICTISYARVAQQDRASAS